jgi:dihydrofolate reductase
MRKLIVSEFLTLDGVMEDPGGAEGFRHGGWSLASYNEQYSQYKYDELFETDALLLGRKTYEGFAAAWPGYEKEDKTGFAKRMNTIPKYVVSSQLKTLGWNNSHFIRGNIGEEVAKLKKQPGQNILVAGSATLVNSLSRHNLINEYRLMVHPLVLGSGKKLFTEREQVLKLKLKHSQVFDSGTIVLHYID